MATRETGTRGSVSRVFGMVVQFVLVGVFTAVETVTLVVWLAIVEDASVVSQASAIGITVLVAGLVLEHFLTDFTINRFDVSFPLGRGLLISVSEAVLWVLWLLIAERLGGLEGLAVAGVVLAVLLVPQHTIEDNVLRGGGLFTDIINLGTVTFSIVESVGATLWLLFVLETERAESLLMDVGLSSVDPAVIGVGILAVTLFVEHNMGVLFARRS